MPLIVHGHLRPNHKTEIVLQIPIPDWLTVELVTKDEQRRGRKKKKKKGQYRSRGQKVQTKRTRVPPEGSKSDSISETAVSGD